MNQEGRTARPPPGSSTGSSSVPMTGTISNSSTLAAFALLRTSPKTSWLARR
jgi:hypothetical protein